MPTPRWPVYADSRLAGLRRLCGRRRRTPSGRFTPTLNWP